MRPYLKLQYFGRGVPKVKGELCHKSLGKLKKIYVFLMENVVRKIK